MKTFRLFLFALAVFLAATSVSPGEEPDAYAAELQRARSLLAGGKNEDAIQSFKRANKLRNNASVECHLGLAQAYQNLGAWKNAVKSADQVLERASDTDTRVQAHNLKGMVFMGQAKDKPDKLKDAEQSFRAALELKPDYAPTRYNLGVALLKQGRDPEGITELETYLKLSPSGVRADEARRYIENPRRARENFAPEFSLTTADGEYFSLDDLQGKVVLLDFWATWCKPCIVALPDLKGVHKKYSREAGDNFVLISLSWDNDEDKWRSYIQKEGMEWAHYLDRDHRLGRLFNVRAIPTYILIDGEGIIRHQAVGTFETVFIGGEVKKSLKALAEIKPEAHRVSPPMAPPLRLRPVNREDSPAEPESPADASTLPPPQLLTPGPGTVIPQNDRTTGCPADGVMGYGHRIVFDWSDVAAANGLAGYELVAGRVGARHSIIKAFVAASHYEETSCNTYVADHNLEGWQWRVRAKDEDGNVSE